MLLVGNENDSILSILLFEIIAVFLVVLLVLLNNDTVLSFYYTQHLLKSSIDVYPDAYFHQVPSSPFYDTHTVGSSALIRSANCSLNFSKEFKPNNNHLTTPDLYKFEICLLKYYSIMYRFLTALVLSLSILVVRLMTNSVSGFEFNPARDFGPGMYFCWVLFLFSSCFNLELASPLGILGRLPYRLLRCSFYL